MTNHVAGTFNNRYDVEQAISDLRAIGIKDDRMSLIVSQDTHGTSFRMEEATKAPEGMAIGGVVGATVGGIVAALATTGAVIATGGLGLIVAGPIVGALAGIGTGAVTGGLVGGLVGLGFDEYEAKHYDESIKQGKILMILENLNNNEKKHAKEVIKKHGSESK